MTMPAEKSMTLLSTRFEPLLLRHPDEPDPDRARIGHTLLIVCSMRARRDSRMAPLCCFAAWKTAAACRIFAPRALETASMDGKSIVNQP